MKTRTIALNAIMTVLVVIFSFIPVHIGPIKLAVLLLLPVIIVSQIEGIGTAIYIGFVTGLMSCILAIARPVSPVAIIFRNPMISIFPRIMIGVLVFSVSKLIDKIILQLKVGSKMVRFLEKYAQSFIVSAVGVVTNTGFVLLMIWTFYANKTVSDVIIGKEFMMGLISINFFIEILLVSIITPPIVYAIRRYLHFNKENKIGGEHVISD